MCIQPLGAWEDEEGGENEGHCRRREGRSLGNSTSCHGLGAPTAWAPACSAARIRSRAVRFMPTALAEVSIAPPLGPQIVQVLTLPGFRLLRTWRSGGSRKLTKGTQHLGSRLGLEAEGL